MIDIKVIKMENYLLYFFIYGTLGWMLEVSFQSIKTGKFINRGFLNGPICPIYGVGAAIVIFFLSGIADSNKLMLFLGSIFIATVIELITGFLLDKIFHKHWWDYSDRRFNIGGYVCLEFSIAWGFLCLFLYDINHPLVQRMVDLIPYKAKIYILITLSIIIFIDFISTLNTLIGLNKRFKIIDKVNSELRVVSDDIGEKIYEGTIRLEDIEKYIKDRGKDAQVKGRFSKSWDRFNAFQEKRLLKAFPNLRKEIDRIEELYISKIDENLRKTYKK